MEIIKEKIKIQENDPGAVRHGNFINYYTFHPAKKRIEVFPKDIWKIPEDGKCLCLDIGCNTGELTSAMLNFLHENLNDYKNCYILGVDLDSVLIERAIETNQFAEFIEYKCLDIMNNEEFNIIEKYLNKFNKKTFDIVFCMSITMWIHLNHGDAGLEHFLTNICDKTNMVVIEPQPRKCYREAIRRLKRANKELFTSEIANNMKVMPFIENILRKCGFIKIAESSYTNWKRQVLFYIRREQ